MKRRIGKNTKREWKQCIEIHNEAYQTETKVHVSARETLRYHACTAREERGTVAAIARDLVSSMFSSQRRLSTSSQLADFLCRWLTVSTDAIWSVMLELFMCYATSYTHASHKQDTFLFCV
jgi:hypothetical protein